MNPPETPSRTPRPHVHTLRVFYGDTDQMGVAYYANYLRWFEMARNEYLRAVGYPYRRLETEGFILPVTEAGCRYLRPARYDDVLHVEARIEELGRVRVRFAYRIRREGDEEPVAEGFTVHACLNAASSSPCRVPESLRQAALRFQSARP